MRRGLKRILKEAKSLKKNDETRKEFFAVRAQIWAGNLAEAQELVKHIDAPTP